MALFRKEVTENQQQRLQGTVVLTQSLSLSAVVIAIIVIVLILLSFLSVASYSRKETVRGYLKPDKGVIKTYGQLTGYVDELYVTEGEVVAVGQPLLALSTHAQFAALAPTGNEQAINQVALTEQLTSRLKRQIQLLEQENAQYQSLQVKELESLTARHATLINEQLATAEQGKLLDQKLAILTTRLTQIDKLYQQGFVSEREKQSHRQQKLDLQQERQALKRGQLQQQRQLTQMQFELQTIPEQYQLKINGLNRQQAQLQNQLERLQSNNRYIIRANRNGTITGLQVVAGESVNPNTLLLNLIPENSVLFAQLYLPTRSAGFITSGQAAKLRFDAFPHQRFGFVESSVMQIDQTIIKPEELAAPFGIREPVYRIQAKLNAQEVLANNNRFPLRSGMLLQADIILEERSVLAWLFEPLLAASRKF